LRAVVLDVELDSHRLLARVFLEHFGAEAGDARNDEEQLADQRWKSKVVQNGRERAVDVEGNRLDACGNSTLECPGEGDARPGQTVLRRQAKQYVDARVNLRVYAMPETGQPRFVGLRFVDPPGRLPLQAIPL